MSDEHESPDEFLDAHRSRKRLTIAIALGVSLAVTGAVVWFIATRKPTPKRPPADAAPEAKTVEDLDEEYVAHRRQIALETLAKACDADDANDELKDLAREDDWAGVVIIGNAWLGRCPADEQVRWKLFKALEELGRWEDADAEATRLIAMNPLDVDYWWWRGKARKETGDGWHSAADYRQSIALSEMAESHGINVMGYADVAPPISRACDAAFALRWWGHRNGGDVRDSALSKLRSLSEYGQCERAIGDGEATITLAEAQPLAIDTATVQAKIDLHVPYVVIDAATAEKAALDLSMARTVDLVLDGAVVQAKLVTGNVAIGALSAPGVELAVVDQVSPARVGLGFWWRFDWAPSDDGNTAAVSPMFDPGAL